MAELVDDLIVRGDLLIPLGSAARTDKPAVMDGYTLLSAYKSGSTIILQAYDPVAAVWRTGTLS